MIFIYLYISRSCPNQSLTYSQFDQGLILCKSTKFCPKLNNTKKIANKIPSDSENVGQKINLVLAFH